MNKIYNKKSAFTLAEVLVTLGIIGILSAITMPSLVQNWQRKAYATQLHKVYNEIQQSFEKAKTDRMALNLFESGYFSAQCGGQSAEREFLHTYFKVVKDCGLDHTGCFSDKYRNIANGTQENSQARGYAVTTAGGASIAISAYQYSIFIDTNGTKGPNVAGRDFFRMAYNGDGIYVYGDININDFTDSCRHSHSAWYCFDQLIKDDWEMKY